MKWVRSTTLIYLMIELGRRGERKNETGYVEIDEPKTIGDVFTLVKSLNHTEEMRIWQKQKNRARQNMTLRFQLTARLPM